MRRALILASLAAVVALVLSANVFARTAGGGCPSGYQKTAANGSLHQYDTNKDGVVCTKKGATTIDN